MSHGKRLQVVGWGPIRLPGERQRIERLEKAARELLMLPTPEPHIFPEGTQTASVGRGADSMTAQGPLGQRKLYVAPDGPAMHGPDVLHLQGNLKVLGYDEVGELDGVFGPKTRDALVHFQNDYGIFTDGVCARVSVIVLNYLQEHGVTADNPATDRQKRVIYWSVSAQRSGMVIVGTADRADTHGSGQADFLTRLRHRVERSIEIQAQLQTLPVQSDLSPSERTSFANAIKAELVILLDVRDEAGEGGIATYYFSKANAVSDVGAPLANYIGEELVIQTGAKDLGSHAEDSEDLMLPAAPTVRVEVGNFGDPSDLARFLGGPEYFDRIGTGIALGITRVYMLGARSSPTGSAPVGSLSRRESRDRATDSQ